MTHLLTLHRVACGAFVSLYLLGCGSDNEGSAASGKYAVARQECVDRINAFRATEGLPAYTRWTSAEARFDRARRVSPLHP